LKSRIPNTNHLINNTHSINNGQPIPSYNMPRNPQLGPTSVRGVMLMVVLLSFGLLVGNVGFPGLKHMSPGSAPARVFDAGQGQYKPVSNPTLLMDLLSTKGSSQSEHQHFAERLTKKDRDVDCHFNGTEPACSLSMESSNSMDMRESDSEEIENPSISSSTANNHMEDDEIPSTTPSTVLEDVANKADSKKEPSTVTSATSREETVAPSPASFDWKPNTTYLMCSTMKHILPPTHISQQFDPGNPQNLTFFILPNDKGKDSKEESEKVLEITCLMSSMSVLPIESMATIQSAFH